jgi:hypothetical protein
MIMTVPVLCELVIVQVPVVIGTLTQALWSAV